MAESLRAVTDAPSRELDLRDVLAESFMLAVQGGHAEAAQKIFESARACGFQLHQFSDEVTTRFLAFVSPVPAETSAPSRY
jgi:hypothetical protein